MPTDRRRRSPTRGDLRAVELVETDLPGAPPAPASAATPGTAAQHSGRPAPGTGTGRPRRQARWVLACVVALVVAPAAEVATGHATGDAGFRGEGALAPLRAPVTEEWSRAVSLWSGAVDVGGLIVGVENTPGGGSDVVALDATTGATAWHALPSEPVGRTVTLRCAAGTPRPCAGAPRLTVRCLVAQRTGFRVDRHTDEQVVTLDAATGSVISRRAAEATPPDRPDVPDASPAATDLPRGDESPTISVTAAGALVARADSPGGERWRLDGPFFPGLLLVVGTRVLVADATTVTGVDRRTGARLWTASVQRVPGALLLTDGRLVVTTVSRPDGRGLLALGVDDGRPRWTSPLDDDLRAVALGDRLYGLGFERLVALR
jgi:outer membrane protein assembly factor BamB